MVQDVPLCVPARPAGTQGTLQPQPAIAARTSSAASLAMSAGDFSFSTCLSLLEEYFSDAASLESAFSDAAITQADAYFNLGAFGFDDGKRVGIFQRTEQFSDIVRFLNSFLLLRFPGCSWSSICVSHNVRTLSHTDAGNKPGSNNFTISLGNFCGGEVWLSPPLSSSSTLFPAPADSRSKDFLSSGMPQGEIVDTFETALTFPCEHVHCTCPFSGERWVLTAYTCRGLANFTPEQISYIRSLGFPLEISASATQKEAPKPASACSFPAHTGSPGFFLDICCGANAPLSESLRMSGVQCVCVDALGSEPLDLLNDKTYDNLLRLAFSGIIRMAHAAPPCKEYSRLKLRPGGPRAIRSPDFLNGFPDNTRSQQQRVEVSQKLMYRSVCILRAVFASGGHASLEQPTNSMAWLEPFVQDFISEVQATLSVIPACSVGVEVAKQWLFASSFAPIQQLAGTCSHKGQHQSVIGTRDEQGHFLSQRTAEYPSALTSRYSNIVSPLFEGHRLHECSNFCSLSFALQCIPRKERAAPPFGAQDGGGIYSTPDWSYGPRYQSDLLSDLRKEWQQWLLENHVPARLAQHVATHSEKPLFTEEETTWLQQSFKRFSDKHSTSQDWDFSVPPGQPYCLSALSRLSHLVADKDTSLFPALMQGVPTGFDKDIPRSHTLRPRRESDGDEGHELLICEGNWKGAEEDPALLQQLVEEELEAGYLEVVPDLETAFRRWGKERVAVGKVNIVKAPGRSPRLVVDNSICNTNHCCHVPEQFSMPSLQDIQASFPLREDNEEVQGFSLDVKGAHKTSRVREQDIGLLGIRQQERLLFYKVCPFGATLSSHWFARLGGFFTRCLHLLIWLAHVLLLYVDDLLLFQNSQVLPLSSALTLAFCACFKIPLSWKKLQMGPTITWIGWEINLSAACFSLPEAKRNKLCELVSDCLRHRQVSRKQLDKLLGLLQWILHGMLTLRPWLSSLYDDRHRPLGTNVSISPTFWAGISSHLDEELLFTSSPPGTAIRQGAKLLSARHFDMQTKADLVKVPVSTKRIWMRVADPSSSRRKLCPDSIDVLRFFKHLSSVEWRPRPLRPPALVAVETAADAFGKGNNCGIGGWLRFPSGRMIWFSQLFEVHHFTALGIPVQSNANLDISSYETLAQCFVLLAFWKCSGAGRLALKLPALSDNSGAEAVCNKLYTSKTPLNLFVRKLCMWSALSGISLECSHIAGEKNDDADFLSRWDGDASSLPSHFRSEDRFPVNLPAFWKVTFSVSLFPQDAKLLWKLPASYTLGPASTKSTSQP